MKRRILYSVILLAVAVAAVEAMKYGHGAAAAAAKPVIAAPETTVICAAGVIEPATEVIKLAAQVAGVLRDVPVEEGQRLRRGQVIAVIENADFVARVAAAEATVKERQASIDRLVNGSREQERRGAEAAVAEAKSVLADARADIERKTALFESGVLSRAERERAERDYHVAEARLTQATEHFALVDAPARSDELAPR